MFCLTSRSVVVKVSVFNKVGSDRTRFLAAFFFFYADLAFTQVLVIKFSPKLKGTTETVRRWGTNLPYIIATFCHGPCAGEGSFLSLLCSLLISFSASSYLPVVLISICQSWRKLVKWVLPFAFLKSHICASQLSFQQRIFCFLILSFRYISEKQWKGR